MTTTAKLVELKKELDAQKKMMLIDIEYGMTNDADKKTAKDITEWRIAKVMEELEKAITESQKNGLN